MSEEIKIPENYQAVMPYLIVKDALGFKDFAISVFGAKELFQENGSENIIRHAEITIHGSVIMFADSTPQAEVSNAGLFVYVSNADETYKKAIEAGAKSISAPSNQSYGRTCGIKGPFGNTWWITGGNID